MVTRSLTRPFFQRSLPAGLLAGCLLAGAGCKQLSPGNKETPQPAAAPPAAAAARGTMPTVHSTVPFGLAPRATAQEHER